MSPAVAGLLLAAGAGTRLGRPKALVRDRDGTPWVERAAHVLQAAGAAPVAVAVGADADAVRACVPRGALVVDVGDWSDGMGHSLRAGLSGLATAALDVDAVLVMLVDTPGVGVAVARRLLDRASRRVLARAAYDGVPGHPVLLGREHWSEVIEVTVGDRGARDLLRERDVELVECGDVGFGDDIDTTQQLAEYDRSTSIPE